MELYSATLANKDWSCGGLTESVGRDFWIRGCHSNFTSHLYRSGREIQSEMKIYPQLTVSALSFVALYVSDAVAEQPRPDTLEPTGFGRGDPAGEVEFVFSCTLSIVSVVSLCHTDE